MVHDKKEIKKIRNKIISQQDETFIETKKHETIYN